MRQIGFYFLFILSFVNRDIWGMKEEEEDEEEMNWEEEFNNNYCITDEGAIILNLSDLEKLNLYEDKNGKLKTLKEKLESESINVIEFCTAEENTIKFKVIEEEKEIEGDVKYFSYIDKTLNISNTDELYGGIVEDTILITKEGKLRNFENKKEEIKTKEKLFLAKKPVKESLIFDKSFEANNAKNNEKTEFECSCYYLEIQKQIATQKFLEYNNKQHIFFYGYNKLEYYWDENNKNIYFFQAVTGNKVFSFKAIPQENIKNLEKDPNFEVYNIFETRINIEKKKEKKSCCQKCCDNCI